MSAAVVPQYGFDDYLHVAVAELWHYGAEGAQVPGRLAVMLRDLHAAALPEHRPAVWYWLTTVQRPRPEGAGPAQ